MDNSIPFYLQIKRYLKQKLVLNELKPGDIIPSERELTERFAMSRSTVRKAIDELVYEGYLVKVQGKGTFVAKHDLEKELTKITGLNRDCPLEVKAELLQERIMDATAPEQPEFVRQGFEKKIYFMERAIRIDEQQVGIQKIWSYPEFINEINSQPLDELELIGDEYYEEISIVNKKITVKGFNSKNPVLRVCHQIYQQGKAVIYSLNYYHTQQIKLTKRVKLKKGGVGQAK